MFIIFKFTSSNMYVLQKPITDRFQSKLSLRKVKSLSFGGQVTLIKAGLGSLPTYYFSLFKALSDIVDDLEIIRRFF